MADEPRLNCRYRILRYVPNLIRDEWVNVGVMLEEAAGADAEGNRARREVRLIEEDAEIARVRRLHPDVDVELLRALPAEFDEFALCRLFERDFVPERNIIARCFQGNRPGRHAGRHPARQINTRAENEQC